MDLDGVDYLERTRSNIFGKVNDRASISAGYSGTPHFNHFSGTNSPFFSLSYKQNPRLEFIAEISSDDYHGSFNFKGISTKKRPQFAFKYKLAQDLSIMGN